MRNYLFIGINSTIAQAVIQKLISEGHQIYGTSRQAVSNPDERVRFTTYDPVNDLFPKDFLPERLDGIVYFPGTIDLKPFRGLKPEHFQNEMDINFMGAVKSIQGSLKNLGENSSIVLLSTVAVQKGMSFHASIASAKGAIEGLTRSLAVELAPKIRVNAIAPSLTNTKLAEKLLNSDKKLESSKDRHPLKEIGQPEDIAEMTAFLLSKRSKWVTGQIIAVDGGMSVA